MYFGKIRFLVMQIQCQRKTLSTPLSPAAEKSEDPRKRLFKDIFVVHRFACGPIMPVGKSILKKLCRHVFNRRIFNEFSKTAIFPDFASFFRFFK